MQWLKHIGCLFRCQEADSTICLSDNCLSVLIYLTVSIQCCLIVKDGNASWTVQLLRCSGSLYMIISASIELDLSNLHSYWYSKCKILYFLHEMAWMRLWWSNYLVKQFFVGVNHVFSCILFTSMDSDLYSVCQQIFMAYNQRILTHGNWRIIINYEVASHRWLVTREMLIPPIICAEKVAANHINVDPC